MQNQKNRKGLLIVTNKTIHEGRNKKSDLYNYDLINVSTIDSADYKNPSEDTPDDRTYFFCLRSKHALQKGLPFLFLQNQFTWIDIIIGLPQ